MDKAGIIEPREQELPLGLPAREVIKARLEQMARRDSRFQQLQEYRTSFEGLLTSKTNFLNSKRISTHGKNFGELIQAVKKLRGGSFWEKRFEPPAFPTEVLQKSIFAIQPNTPEMEFFSFIVDLIDNQLIVIDQDLRKEAEKVNELSLKLSLAFPETKEFISLIIDELLIDLEVKLTPEQRAKIELFVFDPSETWRIKHWREGNVDLRVGAFSTRLPGYFLLDSERAAEDTSTMKHELIHRLKENGIILQDINLPIASAVGELESLKNLFENEGPNQYPFIAEDFDIFIADAEKYDLDVIYASCILKKELEEPKQGELLIAAQMNVTPTEAEPLQSYYDGADLAQLAILLERASQKWGRPITAEHFLAELAKNKLPSEIYSVPAAFQTT